MVLHHQNDKFSWADTDVLEDKCNFLPFSRNVRILKKNLKKNLCYETLAWKLTRSMQKSLDHRSLDFYPHHKPRGKLITQHWMTMWFHYITPEAFSRKWPGIFWDRQKFAHTDGWMDGWKVCWSAIQVTDGRTDGRTDGPGTTWKCNASGNLRQRYKQCISCPPGWAMGCLL